MCGPLSVGQEGLDVHMHAITIRRALVSTIGAVALLAGSLGVLASASAAPVSSGVVASVDSDKNHTSYWESVLAGKYPGVKCVKYDNVDAKTFTVPAPDDGYDWVYAIVKAGANESVDQPNEEHSDVSEGDVLSHSSGKDISHVILCEAPSKQTTTTTTTTKTTSSTTSPSTGPVVETDVTGGSSGFGTTAGLAILIGGIALTIGGLRRPVRKH